MKTKQGVERWVIGADLHWPKADWLTVNAMMELIRDPDVPIHGFGLAGDQFDNEEISHHNKGKPYYQEKSSYKTHQETFDKMFLSPLEKALDKKKVSERFWIQGNHDDWEFQFIERHPELEGMLERRQSLKLDKRGWEFIPLAHAKRVGELNVIHGEILTGVGNQAGMYPSRKAVELYAGNVLAGHTHAPQSFTKVSPVEHKKKHMGWISPILGATNPTYLKNRPTAWLNGFNIVEVYDKGWFNCYPVIVVDGMFAYGGKVYGRK